MSLIAIASLALAAIFVLVCIWMLRYLRLLVDGRRRFFGFVSCVDRFFSTHPVGYAAQLGYRSRIIAELARTPAERIAAVHILLGAVEAAAQTEPKNDTTQIRLAAESVLAKLYALPTNPTQREVEEAKRKLLARFEDDLQEA